MNGFINVIKPEGMSSAYAVGGVKLKLKIPCGHMGTLDPLASGVLPVGVGKASRLFDYLLNKTKVYEAVFRFGELTNTLDITGEVSAKTENIPTKEEIIAVLGSFIGEIDQVPPNFSAKCINGKRGYQLARKGVEFTLAPKKVTILKYEFLEQISKTDFKFRITCKGGTYIRSLARDLGYKLNSLAIMVSLNRTESGVFNYNNGVTFNEFTSSSNPEKYLIPADSVVDFAKLVLTNEQATKLLNGLYEKYGFEDGIYRVYNQTEFWGIGKVVNGILKMSAYVR